MCTSSDRFGDVVFKRRQHGRFDGNPSFGRPVQKQNLLGGGYVRATKKCILLSLASFPFQLRRHRLSLLVSDLAERSAAVPSRRPPVNLQVCATLPKFDVSGQNLSLKLKTQSFVVLLCILFVVGSNHISSVMVRRRNRT